ncbi:hypothetical protein RRG08_036848 [Elysia crispata]|uniref:Uncharacterized protein n=1 Tax=Elysia crispata TaxID=231223 RepID=A0AAE0Z725_9GAST|nr:hypothetical protein RRG08_036848 [Elysia crispata]
MFDPEAQISFVFAVKQVSTWKKSIFTVAVCYTITGFDLILRGCVRSRWQSETPSPGHDLIYRACVRGRWQPNMHQLALTSFLDVASKLA